MVIRRIALYVTPAPHGHIAVPVEYPAIRPDSWAQVLISASQARS